MKWVLGIILVVMYVGNYPLISFLYPQWESDYDQFLLGYALRNKIYEVMFCLFFYTMMVSMKGFTRAVFVVGFVMSAASCFDKIVFNVSQYLRTDVLVVLVAIFVAGYGYIRERNARQDR